MCSAFLIDRKEDRATVGPLFQVVFLLGSEMMLVIALFFF